MYNGLLILSVLTDEILIISGEVNDSYVGGYVVEDLVLLEELSLWLGEIVELNRVQIHLRRGN